jgi:hypothetical protein
MLFVLSDREHSWDQTTRAGAPNAEGSTQVLAERHPADRAERDGRIHPERSCAAEVAQYFTATLSRVFNLMESTPPR